MSGALVFGVGLNDANYTVNPVVSGKSYLCPIYSRWQGMLERCYSKKYQVLAKTYSECTVCEEWLTFSNFKAWMEQQDWEGKQLDKDIIKKGNKIYSPENCAFISQSLNLFVVDSLATRGEWLIGVCFIAKKNKFYAQCRNPFTKGKAYLGYFKDEISAHKAWRERKHFYACQLADLQTDERVANALRTRYLEV